MGKKLTRRSDDVWNQVYEPFVQARRKASDDTQAIQWMIERKLLELAMNRFEWKGLPKEVDIRWLEMSLNFYALSVFHYDPEYDKFFAMRGSGSGELNMVGNPTEFIVYGNAYYQKTLKADKCVPIWANYMRMPDWDIIRIYSARLAQMDRTIEINAMNARKSKIITVNENGRLTAELINQQIEAGRSTIPVDDSVMVADLIKSFDLGVDPDQILNMHMVRTREWAEVMTLLGINNSNQDKKERLVASETAGNDDMIASIRATNLQARQQACERINEMFPALDVSVEYVTGMVTDPDLRDPEEKPGSTSDDKQKVEAD